MRHRWRIMIDFDNCFYLTEINICNDNNPIKSKYLWITLVVSVLYSIIAPYIAYKRRYEDMKMEAEKERQKENKSRMLAEEESRKQKQKEARDKQRKHNKGRGGRTADNRRRGGSG